MMSKPLITTPQCAHWKTRTRSRGSRWNAETSTTSNEVPEHFPHLDRGMPFSPLRGKDYPAPMPQSIRHRTIGDFIEHRTRLSFTCGGCGELREIDLQKLGERLGMDFSLYDRSLRPTAERLPRVTCAGCGGKPVGLIVSPWTLPPERK